MVRAVLLAFIVILAVAVFYRFILIASIPGITVTSWFRNPFKNQDVGGMQNSLHLIGWAFDIVPADTITQANVIAGLAGFPNKIVPEGDHLHVQIV